jgi:hypothetical protein
MTLRMRLGYAMVLLFCLVMRAIAQPVADRQDTRDRVLDLLFPSDMTASPYLMKITLRFSDSDTQLVILTHPVYPVHSGGRAEVVTYSIAGMGNGNLSQFISDMVAHNPQVTDRDIAAKLRVETSHSPIDYEALNHFLSQLKAIRISPVLASRVAVDEYSRYDFWYDGGQESVHYTLTGPFKDSPQDQLVQWMIRFRASLPTLIKSSHHG